jgi:4'-phosphopantetheinyl transferase
MGALAEAVVEVWVAPLDVPPETLAVLVASLTPAERARAARFRGPDVARRFSAARGWLRLVLGAALTTAPAEVRLSPDGAGKPRVVPTGRLRFNLSHAGDLALIAVAEHEVGVDVEHVDSGPGGLEAVALACSPAEAAALDGLPPPERPGAFLRLWTAKEAYLKATGVGLATSPATFEVGPADPAGASPVVIDGDTGAAHWWVRRLAPVPGYVGAVAAEGRDWVVELRDVGALPLPAPA